MKRGGATEGQSFFLACNISTMMADASGQLAKSAVEAARELVAAHADGNGFASISTLSIRIGCVVCFALLRKAKTLHCGHSVCASCATKIAATNLCPLPGPACRSLEKLVTDQHHSPETSDPQNPNRTIPEPKATTNPKASTNHNPDR